MRARLHGKFHPVGGGGTEFCSPDYIANLTRAKFRTFARENLWSQQTRLLIFPLFNSQRARRIVASSAQAKFNCGYMEKYSPFDRAENSSPVSVDRAGTLTRAETSYK